MKNRHPIVITLSVFLASISKVLHTPDVAFVTRVRQLLIWGQKVCNVISDGSLSEHKFVFGRELLFGLMFWIQIPQMHDSSLMEGLC